MTTMEHFIHTATPEFVSVVDRWSETMGPAKYAFLSLWCASSYPDLYESLADDAAFRPD